MSETESVLAVVKRVLDFCDSREPKYLPPATETARPLLPKGWPTYADLCAINDMAKALSGLVEACSHVRPLCGDVSTETVKDMRNAMDFMEAWETARTALLNAEGKPVPSMIIFD